MKLLKIDPQVRLIAQFHSLEIGKSFTAIGKEAGVSCQTISSLVNRNHATMREADYTKVHDWAFNQKPISIPNWKPPLREPVKRKPVEADKIYAKLDELEKEIAAKSAEVHRLIEQRDWCLELICD